MFGLAVQGGPSFPIAGSRRPSELGGYHHSTAVGSERFTHQLLVAQWSIYFGGVKKRDAAFDGSAQQRNHLLSVFRRSIGPAHAHATETECRDFKIAFAK